MRVFYMSGILANFNKPMFTSIEGNLYVSNKGVLHDLNITEKIVDMRIMK